ncbi:MAG: hypothetical protein ACOC80_04105 [Petrotogales bacterium]
MSGYQDFVDLFGSGVFIRSNEIKKKYSLQKALSSVYVIPTFFKGIYYVPMILERKGHFILNKQEFFISLFNIQYGRKKWYWALSTAARYYGFEWSATQILEIVTMERTKTIKVAERIASLRYKRSYRSATLAKYYDSLDVNLIYIHQGKQNNFESIKIDDELGPVCTKEQLFEDIKQYCGKIRDQRLKRIYDRIIEEF